jgi:hypothetical protein
VLEQLIYKWDHSRQIIADALFESYENLRRSGRAVTREEIVRDVTRMFSGNFEQWVGRSLALAADSLSQPLEVSTICVSKWDRKADLRLRIIPSAHAGWYACALWDEPE